MVNRSANSGLDVCTSTKSQSMTGDSPMDVRSTRVLPALVFLILYSLILSSCGGSSGSGSQSPAFSVSAAPTAVTVIPGSSNTDEITVQPSNGFTGQVSVTISNLPSGVTVSPNPLQLSVSDGAGSQPVTITAASNATLQNVGLVVTGTSGNTNSTASLQLYVQAFDVTTWHYDNSRTGVNPTESILTLANVNTTSFGELFSLPVDGAVIGQPLYLSNISIPSKGVHNVLYAATMNDSVYAFDADSNNGSNASPLWQSSLLPAGATPVPISVQGCSGVTGWTEEGVVSTPVIDPSTGTIYVVAKTYESDVQIFRLHALDVTTGKEKLGGPVEITATFTLAGDTSVFNTLAEVNRPALLLTNGHIYLAFGSNGCNAFADQGWVLSYNAATLAQEGVFNTEPAAALASIWQKDGGLSADSDSNIYAEVAEGAFTPGTNFGSNIIKLSQVGTNLQLADWFAPYNQAYISQHDLDLNDPVLLLPDQPGPNPHLALGVGKEGTVYVLNRDHMGHYCSTCTEGDTQIVQELLLSVGYESGALVYWNSTIYSSGVGTPIMAWSVTNGMLSTSPVFESTKVASEHAPIITSNGADNGILWQINGTNLTAYNALNLLPIYVMSQGQDVLPPLPHFSVFMVANGKLYVSTNNSVVVFGLL